MSVQRFSAYYSGDPSQIGLWADPEGYWVTYADHARIVAGWAEHCNRVEARTRMEMEQAHAAAVAAAVDEYARGVEAIIAERVAETVRYELLVQPPAAPRTLSADENCPKCSHPLELWCVACGQLSPVKPTRTLSADDPEPAEWSIVRDRSGVAFQLYLGWRSPDAFYMLWPDFIAARGPVTLIWNGDTDAPVR